MLHHRSVVWNSNSIITASPFFNDCAAEPDLLISG
jgi:hypothetical protein